MVIAVVIIAIATAAPLAAAPALAPSAAEPTPNVPGNLLVNPGFESPYGKQCCQTDLSIYLPNTPVDEVQTAQGWFGWWRQPDSSPNYPSRCDLPSSERICKIWHRPEWREAAPYANRIRTGTNAQKYFTFWSVHEAGMYQRVTGIKPGAKLQFSAYMSAWSTATAESLTSEGQQTMTLKVGIDPYGGTDPFSPNIVWSAPGDSYDTFAQFTVQATAAANAVTVFTYSQPVYPLQHNDVYVDDAALVVAGGNVSATSGTSGTGGTRRNSGSATPAATATKRPGTPTPDIVPGPFPNTTMDRNNGNIYYVVQAKDTVYSLALRFSTTVNTIVKWNSLKSADLIKIGKTIIVGKSK